MDADFAGNWNKEEAFNDRDTAHSRHGYFIMYAGCPIVWKSQLQMEIALTSTESEYMGLSYALQEAIHMMEILKEMKHYGFPVTEPMFKYAPKVRNLQIVTASRLRIVLDLRPSTTNKLTTTHDPKFAA